jgi:hypothetical protein
MKKVLEDYGLKVNNSMSKVLLKRLYNELEEYVFNDGKMPEYLYELANEREEAKINEEVQSEHVPFILPSLDIKLQENINVLNS